MRPSPTPPKDEHETLSSLYFSFEGAPVRETWYQTYQRLVDGTPPDNAFAFDSDLLRFVLPYEMPKEYLKDHSRRFLLSRKKCDLAELVRKSPRCHASTLALFSNIFPPAGKKGVKSGAKAAAAAGVKVEEGAVSSSDSAAHTPLPEPIKLPLSDALETEEEMRFIGQCMERVMKAAVDEAGGGEAKAAAGKDARKSGSSKKRVKGKKGPSGGAKEVPQVEAKVFDNPLTPEMDAAFLANLPHYLEEVSLVPEDTLCRNSVDLLAESCLCECTERTSCDENSSMDERTEVSSESMSVCDSETLDSFNSNFSAKVRKNVTYKKRRKNLTGWPTQKRKRPAPLQVSDDNDSTSMGYDDSERKKRRSRTKVRRPFDVMKPCSALSLDALGHDRRSSTRKRSSVLYMDTWPLRFRNHK